jgi:hypothetical protein
LGKIEFDGEVCVEANATFVKIRKAIWRIISETISLPMNKRS